MDLKEVQARVDAHRAKFDLKADNKALYALAIDRIKEEHGIRHAAAAEFLGKRMGMNMYEGLVKGSAHNDKMYQNMVKEFLSLCSIWSLSPTQVVVDATELGTLGTAHVFSRIAERLKKGAGLDEPLTGEEKLGG
jgi:hypothetical protein